MQESGRNPFATTIALGRTSDNGVVLPAATAQAPRHVRARADGWGLTDQRSADGAWLDGRRLEAGASAALGAEAGRRSGRDGHVRRLTPRALFRPAQGVAA